MFACVGLRPGSAKTPYRASSLDVPVKVPNNTVKTKDPLYMNELEIENSAVLDSNKKRHVVLVHGYGAAKGFFYRNFKMLANFGTLHALDWLGYGLSTRAHVNLPRFKKRKDGVLYAEDWFVSALESWRQKRGIEKFVLVAHSLGAPVSCTYAKKYPHRVEKIVFVSPASVNRTPQSIPPEELYDEQSPVKPAPVSGKTLNVPSWFRWLWEQHCSPFFLVRALGPWGPKITSGWTSRRFRSLPHKDQQALQSYSYSMFNAKGSGEYMLNYFLSAGSSSRWPLAERLEGLKCPSLWLYGDKDWMDVNGGLEAVERLRQMGVTADLKLVDNSGHHLYLDNVNAFNGYLHAFLGRSST